MVRRAKTASAAGLHFPFVMMSISCEGGHGTTYSVGALRHARSREESPGRDAILLRRYADGPNTSRTSTLETRVTFSSAFAEPAAVAVSLRVF
jgi:hypothetical protein